MHVFSMERKLQNNSPLFKRRVSNQTLLDCRIASMNLKNVMIDLENWMGGLPEYLTKAPIIYISIPGSHNSFSYSISPNSEVSPDSPPLVQSLGKCLRPITKHIIFKWSQGQKEDVIQQLKTGIRYFDVRLVVLNDDIVIAHGLYGGKIEGFLEDMNSFLNSHPKEIAILDFQHFYEFKLQHHERMIDMLRSIFGSKICYRERKMRENTLSKLWELNNQVLIVYRNQVTANTNLFWPSGTWETPWPNRCKVSELIQDLNAGLANRKEGMGFVSQGILTPTPKYVATHAFGSLKKLACHTNKKVISWVETKNIGANGINVVICDFVEKDNFSKKVVLLNYKAGEDIQRNLGL